MYKNYISLLKMIMATLCLCLSFSFSSAATPISFPPKPQSETFVADHADMLTRADKDYINEMASELLNVNRTPIYVVTIDSVSQYYKGYGTITIDAYARRLFDDWGIGYKKRNYGMLLLIAKSDRKARIELGADWGRLHDDDAKYIMDKVIIPRFKEERFSEGVLEGTKALNAMVLGLELPSPYLQWWVVPSLVTLSFVCFVVAISMFRSGRDGFGWLLLVIVFMIIWFILETLYETFFGEDAYGGDGFGGGFSGGGGATGGW